MKAYQKRIVSASITAMVAGIIISFTAWNHTPEQWGGLFRFIGIAFLVGVSAVAAFAPEFKDDEI